MAKLAIESAHKAGKLNDTSRSGEYFGRCEYIDYERLKKGIVKSGTDQTQTWSFKTAMAAVGVGMVVIRSSVI